MTAVIFWITFLCLTGIHIVYSQLNYNASYEWKPDDWTGCAYRDPIECCSCYRKRNVHCAMRETGERISPFYCRKLPIAQPAEREMCHHCQQGCVLSIWGEWSQCSETCTPSTRFRTRNVLLLPSGGGSECGALLDIENCVDFPHCEFVSPVPKYSWRVGEWTGCRKNSSGSGDCGPGIKEREVSCVDKRRRTIADHFCLQYMQGQQKPKALLMCHIPCPCTVSQWSSWSSCSHTCATRTPSWLETAMGTAHIDVGIQTRVRDIVERGNQHATGCPHLAEKRHCENGPLCPRYVWKTTEWSECHMTARPEVTCGSGNQLRDVTCIVEGDATEKPVSDSYCFHERYPDVPLNKLRPPERKACEVPCPVHCELGEWENWSVCTQSCGETGQQIRRRSVVQEASHSGEECGDRYDTQPCPPSPCVWWNIEKWSTCFLADYRDSCGAGSQVRNVWCVSSLGEVLQDSNCTETTPKPDIEKPCKIPCPEECEITEWGQWSQCNQSCGYPGGMQTRTRDILTNQGPTPCLNDSALIDIRLCNQIDCDVTMWIVSAWSQCEINPEANRICGQPGSGLQTRQIFCQKENGETANDSECEASRKPAERRECAAKCPRDCVVSDWSEWTTCDAPCGQSEKHRYRKIESVPLNDGQRCPESNQDGMVFQSKDCKRTQACEWYAWNVTSWGRCKSQLRCGHGVQERQVYCVRYDGMLTEDEICMDKVLGAPPSRDRPCYRDCNADCELKEWTEWSECSETCGRSGERTRVRELRHPISGKTGEEQCPDLVEDDVIETVGCRKEKCSIYAWDIGQWSDCIADSPSTCGPGIQKRHVFCRSALGEYTSQETCSIVAPMPERYQSCEVPCQVDCVIGNWGEWGTCSQQCGLGLQTRERPIILNPYNGGADCPTLFQTRTCSIRPCQDFIWNIGPWSACEPYSRFACGRGERSRAITCPAGISFIGECERRQARPPPTESCFLPCQGDCELSEWSDWSNCDCSTHNALQSRIRDVIEDPDDSGRPCESLKDERQCECTQYRLRIGDWSSCIVNSTECGPGTREREIQCVRMSDSVTMPLSYCTEGIVTSTEKCDVHCPRHCELTDFSEWTGCSASCGMDALRIRERKIVRRHNRHGGRKCPERSMLTQMETCDTVACFNYEWLEKDWGECSVDVTSQCGMGMQSRQTVCVRNDGFEVDTIFCGEHNEELKQEAPCGEPCPGDCVLSQWSEWGSCFTDCKDSQGRGYQVRSRTAIAAAEGGKPCPDDWVEKRTCRKEAVCPYFMWKARAWEQYGRRKVYCSAAHEDVKVFGGCSEEERPAKKLECVPKCGIYANCLEGTCECQHGFKGDGQICLPEYGCHSNLHCIANYSRCDTDNKQCLCYDGTLPTHDMVCVAKPLNSMGAETEMSDVLIYVLIGCFCAILVVAITVSACLFGRIKRNPKHTTNNARSSHPPMLSKIDNLENIAKNNENHAKSLNYSEPTSSAYPTYKSDNSEIPDLRLVNMGLQKDVAGVISMPSYYNKPHNNPQNFNSHEPRVYDAAKTYHGSNVSGLNQHPSSEVSEHRLHSEIALPYITIPARSTPTPSEPSLRSFKPHHLESSRVHTPTGFPYQNEPEIPQISVSTQSPPGTYPLTDDMIQNGRTHLQTPDVTHGDSRRHSPRHQRYEKPYARKVATSPLKAMASLPEDSPMHGSNPYPYARPHTSSNHRPSNKEPTNRKSPYIEPIDYQRKQPHLASNEQTPRSPKSRTQQMGKYSSLPRHGTSALNDRDIQSDIEYAEPVQNGAVTSYNPKYGSLPTKGRQRALKSDAAQNLLDYCDALLADLEKAATTS